MDLSSVGYSTLALLHYVYYPPQKRSMFIKRDFIHGNYKTSQKIKFITQIFTISQKLGMSDKHSPLTYSVIANKGYTISQPFPLR